MAAPSPLVFNETYYLKQNPDVAAAVKAGAYKSGLAHWQAFGQYEDRPATPYFDWEVYRDNNPDLVAAGIDTKAELTQHFNNYGYAEARLFLPTTLFNATIYAAQNPDLAAAGITSDVDLEMHFLRSGRYEGRIAVAGFDPVAYINANTDLKAVLAAGGTLGGYGLADISKAGWFHYLNWGITEGRTVPTPNPTVGITAASATVAEGVAQTFTVTLSVPLLTDTTYTYNVTGDTKNGALNAASAGDFGAVTGTVTIPAGATSYTFTVTATADGVTEGLEGYKVTLFDSSLNVVQTSAVVGITDSAAPITSQTFTLTTGADAGTGFSGNTANDTFISAFNFTSASALDTSSTTLTAGDNLNGGAGIDTLSITISGGSTGTAGSASVTPTLTGIEKVLVSSSQASGVGATFDLSLADSNLTNVGTTSSINAGSNVKFTGLSKLVGVEAKGAGDLSVEFAAGVVTGTGDSVAVALNGVGTSATGLATFDINGIETLNVTTASGASYLKLGTNATTGTSTVNVTGAQTVYLDLGAGTGVTAVNASASSAGITVTDINADKVTLTGGAGNDTFNFTVAGGFNASGSGTGTGAVVNDVIAGGSGTDTLVVKSDATIADSAFTNVTSVEVLKVASGAGSGITLDTKAQAAGIATVTETGTGNLNLTIDTGYTGTVTVNLADGAFPTNSGVGTGAATGLADSIVVNASGSANLVVNANANAFANGNTITITGSAGTGTTDTLVLTANGSTGVGAGASLGSTVTNLDTITIATGSSATAGVYLELDAANVASGKTLVVNAGALGTGAGFIFDGGDAISTAKLNVTGGAGNDSIIGGSGADTIIGGSGNDTINATAGGNDSLVGGAGNDTFNLGSALTSGDTIDGGDGNDTLVLSSGTVTSAALANVTNVENLVFSGDATLNSPIQFTSFDLSLATGSGVLTLASGYTGATTVTLGSGDSVINTGANVALTVNVTSANLGTGTGQIQGGTGTDTLNLTASADSANSGYVTNNLGTSASVDKVVIVDGGDAASGSSAKGKDVTLVLGASYANSITVDASALDAGTVTSGASDVDFENLNLDASALAAGKTLTATGGAGDDSITGGSGNDVILGGSGNDSLVAGAGNDNVDAGAGDDTVNLGANFDGNDTVAGGSGNDTLVIDQGTGGVGDLSFLNVTSIETLSLTAGAGTGILDTRAQAAGVRTVTLAEGTNFIVNAAGFSSGLAFDARLSITGGNLSLTGGAGNDTFTFASSGLNASDSITGGSGTDSIVLTNGTGVAVTATGGSAVRGIETISITDGATGTGASTGNVTLTLASGFNSGVAVSVDGSALDSNEVFTFTNSGTGVVSVTGGAGNDVFTGGSAGETFVAGSGADVVSAGAGNDNIDGGAGADTLTGGAGVDTLTGGAGNDVFVISSGDSTSTGVDTITDFSSGDVVRLDVALSSGATLDGTYKGAAASYADALSLLSSKAGQYVFISGSNQVVIDVDGNGLLQGNDLYLALSGVTGITADTIALNATAGNNVTVTGGAANDTLTLSGGTTSVFVGGSGSGDTLNLTGASLAATVSGVENINVTGATNTVTLSGTTAVTANGSADFTISGSTGADTVTIASGNVGKITIADAANTGGTGDTFTLTGSVGADVVALGSGIGITVVDQGSGLTISGAAGAETITIGSGNSGAITVFDTVGGVNVTGTTGDDSITLSGAGASQAIVGGSGNDTLTVAVAATGTFDGGTGTADTIVFGAASSSGSFTLTNVENVTGSGTGGIATLASGGSTTVVVVAGASLTISGAAGAETVTLGSGNSTGLTVVDTAGGLTVSGTTGADTLTIGAGSTITFADNGGALTLSGTTGTETVTLTGTSTSFAVFDTSGLFTLTGTTGADSGGFSGTSANASGSFSLGDGADSMLFSGTAGAKITVDGGSGVDTLTFGSTGLTGTITNVETVVGSTGVDTLVLSNSGADTILVGGSGGTGITWTTITSGDTINLVSGSGVDTVTFGTGFTGTGGLTGLVISNFDAGASGVGDVLDFSNLGLTSSGSTGLGAALTIGDTSDETLGTSGFAFVAGSATLSASDFVTTAGTAGKIVIGNTDSTTHVIFTSASTSSQVVNVYLVNANYDGTVASVSANDIRLVGTINLVGTDTINDFTLTNYTII